MSAWRSPPIPSAAAPIASGPTPGAKVAAVPVVPHRTAVTRTARMPATSRAVPIGACPPGGREPPVCPVGHARERTPPWLRRVAGRELRDSDSPLDAAGLLRDRAPRGPRHHAARAGQRDIGKIYTLLRRIVTVFSRTVSRTGRSDNPSLPSQTVGGQGQQSPQVQRSPLAEPDLPRGPAVQRSVLS